MWGTCLCVTVTIIFPLPRYQVDYQIGVFISRSSVNIFPIQKIWLLAVLQVCFCVFWLLSFLFFFLVCNLSVPIGPSSLVNVFVVFIFTEFLKPATWPKLVLCSRVCVFMYVRCLRALLACVVLFIILENVRSIVFARRQKMQFCIP